MPANKKDVFVFNTAVNKDRKEHMNKLIALNKVIRENLTDISKCVLYSTDIDAPLIAQIPQQQAKDYAVIELFDKDNSNKPNDFNLKIKITQGTLSLNKYKVIAYKTFNREYPVCKMVVKLI